MRLTGIIICFLLLVSCSVSRQTGSPLNKFSVTELQEDYQLYRNIIEELHPGVHWYTSKDSMDVYFEWGKKQLKDSLTEAGFRKVLLYVNEKIHCGHTSIRASKAYATYADTVKNRLSFPFNVSVVNDSVIVDSRLNREDSVLKKGTIITAINNVPTAFLIDTIQKYIVSDGFNTTHKMQVLSTRGAFGAYYSLLYGYPSVYLVEYKDSANNTANITVKPFVIRTDTTRQRRDSVTAQRPAIPRLTKRERKMARLMNLRRLEMDTISNTAYLTINTFSKEAKLPRFLKRTFKELKRKKVNELVIDLRNNGGGRINNSNLLTRYIVQGRFKVGDSVYTNSLGFKYNRYIQHNFFTGLGMRFFLSKGKERQHLHYRYYERKYYRPVKRNHYQESVYILIGGNSFSATTLFAGAVKGQQNVLLVGEETGGGAYGNSAMIISDVRLPNTGVRFKLPRYRLVVSNRLPKNGRGVFPDIEVERTVEKVALGKDFVMEKVKTMIEENKLRK